MAGTIGMKLTNPFALHRDSDGAPYMIVGGREWIDAKAKRLVDDPSAKNMPFSDLYHLAVRDIARNHGIDWDKVVKDSLLQQPEIEPGQESTRENKGLDRG